MRFVNNYFVSTKTFVFIFNKAGIWITLFLYRDVLKLLLLDSTVASNNSLIE